MACTYIRPFGRVLPVPGDSEAPPPSENPPLRMIAHQPLFLPLPNRPDFRSDPRPSFTDPNRYETMAAPQWSLQTNRAETIGTLPPVRQLLSPMSPVGGDASSFPPRFGVMSPAERGAGYFSTRTNDYDRPRHAITAFNIFDEQHTSAPHIQPPYTNIPGQVALTNTSNMRYPPILQTYGGGSNLTYANSSEASQQAWQPLPPNVDVSHQWQTTQGPDYRSSPTSSSMSGQSLREAPTIPKPVLKVVGEKVIPGEGPCYIYEDGTHVRKFIDGEVVNAVWGVTKAGKPRKRLAVACLTCREKKIKCDPGEIKCVQCDKSGRDCRFQTA